MKNEEILMNDGTPLLKYCKKHGLSYSAICLKMKKNGISADEAIEFILKRKCSDKVLNKCRTWQRLKKGYTEEEASLSISEFKKISSNKQSKIVIDGESLGNFCAERGLKYNTVWRYVKRHNGITLKQLAKFYDSQKG